MATPALPIDIRNRILAELKKGTAHAKIALKLKCATGTVSKVKQMYGNTVARTPAELEEAIRKSLRLGPHTAQDLRNVIGAKVGDIQRAIDALQERGTLIVKLAGGAYDFGSTSLLERRRFVIRGEKGEWTHHFGYVTDNHLCNKHSRLDVLNAAYDYFERVGIKHVVNTGNWIDGEAPFNKTELVVAPGMDNQLDYMIDKYPHRKGITTHLIAGEDHEGWYTRRENIDIGNYLQLRAEQQGRNDFNYLGFSEADIALKFGSGEAVARLLHPGGGSAYAISYTAQKIVEAYQGGEKPHILFIGHYHKAEWGYPREVHTLQGGCTCDQTLFMRKNKLAAHVGFFDVKIKQDSRGAVSRFSCEFFPYYDRGYYERRF